MALHNGKLFAAPISRKKLFDNDVLCQLGDWRGVRNYFVDDINESI